MNSESLVKADEQKSSKRRTRKEESRTIGEVYEVAMIHLTPPCPSLITLTHGQHPLTKRG
jgi:hypothetical protein